MRVNLKVPYPQKEQAKKLGAKWDPARQLWYVENVENLSPFLKWMPKHLLKAHEPQKKLPETSAKRWWSDD